MKKISIILVFALVFSFASCGKGEPFSLDVASAAEKILAEVEFYEELYPTDDEMAASLLELDGAFDAKIVMYVGSGASADTIIVGEADNIDALAEKIGTYLDAQEEMYASYMIEEAAKIKNALTETKEKYIVAVVTDDTDGASSVIKDLLK